MERVQELVGLQVVGSFCDFQRSRVERDEPKVHA